MKRFGLLVVIVLVAALLLPAAFSVQAQVLQNTPVMYSDNFNTDSGLWTYVGNAYWDAVNKYVVLTQPLNGQAGILWLKPEITAPFEVQFRYKTGGGTGADGIVFMFYKTKQYVPPPSTSQGGLLAFQEDIGEPAPGYGIEFDTYQNDWDPSAKHIALIKDMTSNHLAYVNDARTDDYVWHQVTIIVGSNKVDVKVDGRQVLTWQGRIDSTFGGMGFGAATGVNNDWHIIKDVCITRSIHIGGVTYRSRYTLP